LLQLNHQQQTTKEKTMLDLMKNAKMEYRQARYERKLKELKGDLVVQHVKLSNAKALPVPARRILIDTLNSFGKGRK